VSAYVAAALEEKTKLDDLAALIDEMLSESGTNDVIDASARTRGHRILTADVEDSARLDPTVTLLRV
jgi:hypothetical protein